MNERREGAEGNTHYAWFLEEHPDPRPRSGCVIDDPHKQ
jgi:hypothetical protein